MTDERCENHNGKPFVLEEATVASVHEAMLDGASPAAGSSRAASPASRPTTKRAPSSTRSSS